MKYREINTASPERSPINFHRHRQHGWRRSPFLLTVAIRMKRNYTRALSSTPTSPDDEFPEQKNN